MLEQIDHVALAVEDLEEAIELYRSIFEMELVHRERVEASGFEMAAFRVGESTLELLAPISQDSVVGRFLSKRGPGVHHIAFRVQDAQDCSRRLQERGLDLVDQEPRRGTTGSSIVFVHPRSTLRALVELVELPDSREQPPVE
jgi:methylmalonyl-CoA epimerase